MREERTLLTALRVNQWGQVNIAKESIKLHAEV